MHSASNTGRELLEQEIQGETYTSLLHNLQQTDTFLRRFSKWEQVVAFMREGTSHDPLKDRILHPILTSHAANQDPRWRSLLLVIFWPGLNSIANRRRKWDPDDEERWQNLVWAFLQTLCSVDPAKRSARLAQKIINDTCRRFYDRYRRLWIRTDREELTDPEQLEALASAGTNIDFDGMDRISAQETEIERLVTHMAEGRLCEEDFLLLIGTRVYGKTAAEYAREMGMDGEVARKRRLRAEATLRESEEKKNPDFVPLIWF
jgi:hypothetical protein